MVGLLLLLFYAWALIVGVMVAAVLYHMTRPRRKTLGVTLGMGGVGDPSELGLTAEAVTFNLSGGEASPGWIVEGDRADGPAAVVVHGHRDSRFGSLYRAELLKPFVRAVAVFDLPGHGDCAAPRCRMGAREHADVLAVADGLPEELTRHGVVLLGYSMGAVIVLKAAAAWPGRFAGVIACAPYRFWDGGLRGQLRCRRLPTWPTVGLVGLVLRLRPKLATGPGGQASVDAAADAARYPGPLLVLHGDADVICDVADGRAVAEAAHAGELVVIEGGTHNQLLRHDGDAVRAAVRAFFVRVEREPTEPA